jgi:hypothetical protein
MFNNDCVLSGVSAKAEERDDHRGRSPYERLEFFFRYEVRLKKQLSVEHIVQDSRTRRQHSGFKNNERQVEQEVYYPVKITVAHHMAVYRMCFH